MSEQFEKRLQELERLVQSMLDDGIDPDAITDAVEGVIERDEPVTDEERGYGPKRY